MIESNHKLIEITLDDLPREVRLWLCGQIGWKQPVHFGIVKLFVGSPILTELRTQLTLHKQVAKLRTV